MIASLADERSNQPTTKERLAQLEKESREKNESGWLKRGWIGANPFARRSGEDGDEENGSEGFSLDYFWNSIKSMGFSAFTSGFGIAMITEFLSRAGEKAKQSIMLMVSAVFSPEKRHANLKKKWAPKNANSSTAAGSKAKAA